MTTKDILDPAAFAALKQAAEQGLLPSLKGHHVAFTGTMSMTRDDMFALVTAMGGFPSPSVAKYTAYLVAADPQGTSTKCQTARRYGIPIMDEETFISRLMQGNL